MKVGEEWVDLGVIFCGNDSQGSRRDRGAGQSTQLRGLGKGRGTKKEEDEIAKAVGGDMD